MTNLILEKPLKNASEKQQLIKSRLWQKYLYSVIAAEISTISRYFDQVVQWCPVKHDPGLLLDAIDCSNKSQVMELNDMFDDSQISNKRSILLMNGTLNYEMDIQGLLSSIYTRLSRHSRIIAVIYNPYLRWFFNIANKIGVRTGELPVTFLTEIDVVNLAKLSNYEMVKRRSVVYSPLKLFGLGDLINRILPVVPLLKWFAFAEVIVLRPIIQDAIKPSLSIVIPTRNEKGNIENALKRMPEFVGVDKEIIFVEGHSKDGTWEEIQRVANLYSGQYQIHTYRQSGIGKADAVRLGFSKASKDLLVILDTDLSMPPELLERFYNAYCYGLGDFINGSRLLYPIEGKAMKFLNKLGNIFFAKALSKTLSVRFGDSLCGTKLLPRDSYKRFRMWRKDFGDFDPFGDFELLFPASVLCSGIVDVPIRYRDRLYGQTNILRFRHGVMLLKMVIIGFFKITLGQTKKLNNVP